MTETESLKGFVGFIIVVIRILIAYIKEVKGLFKRPEKKSVNDQIVLVTGAGRGLGRELALKFAKLGANLALVDINKANNENVKDEILAKYPSLRVATFEVDITDERKVAELARSVTDCLGPVDILINNAGIVQCKPFLELSTELIERTFKVNSFSHFWTIKHFLPSMIERQKGHIVAVASIAGLTGQKYLTDYCASKFAVVGFMESLDRELHCKDGNPDIQLTTVCPSSMSTGMFESFTSGLPWFLPILKPDEVAQKTVDAVLSNRNIIVLPSTADLCLKLQKLIPESVFRITFAYLDYGVKRHSN